MKPTSTQTTVIAATLIAVVCFVFFQRKATDTPSPTLLSSEISHREHRVPRRVEMPPSDPVLSETNQHHGKTQKPAMHPSYKAAHPRAKKAQVSPNKVALESLGTAEQRSLWKAFAEARREVSRIPKARADRAENAGFDFYAINHAQRLTARFGAAGMRLSSSDKTYTEKDQQSPHTAWQATMVLERFAGKTLHSYPRPRKPESHSNKVVYQHSATLSEWYVNGSEGIEHGYTITRRPAGLASGQVVTLGIALDGLKAVASEDAGSLTLVDGKRTVLSYSKLKVVDARGRELPATMQATENGIQLAYQDTNAHYPVTVDPLLTSQEQKLSSDDAATGDYFGYSVAISGDTVVIGALGDGDAGSAYVFTRSGSSWGFQQKLTAGDAAAGDQFGDSVAISGDTVVVGARYDDDGGVSSGSAYVFTRSGSSWGFQQKLTASDGAAYDWFGHAVAISGDTVVVGASQDSHGSGYLTFEGSAYVFTRSGSTWSQQQKLTASDAAQSDYFGNAVEISGDTVVVGAYWDDDAGDNSGSAYIFNRIGTTWTQTQKLTASDAAEGDRFGRAVTISGDTVVVGAYRDDDAGNNSGSAYIFNRITTWTQTQKLTAGDAAEDDNFGYSVAISGDTVVVGARNDSHHGYSFAGSAYVFFRNGIAWYQQAKLTAGDAAAGDRFGNVVAISGDSAIVGAYQDNDGGIDSGSSYIFTRSSSTWSEQQKLTANDADAGDKLGNAVAIAGDTAAVGVWKDDAPGLDWGAVYVFTRTGTTWTIQQKLTASDELGAGWFGYSVDLSKDSLVIGAPLAHKALTPTLVNTGVAYVFTRTGNYWSEQQKLTADDGVVNHFFGGDVGISGDTVVVGARGYDSESGAAYIFSRSGSTWTYRQKLIGNDTGYQDYFGTSVAILGNTMVIGATGHSGSGAAYIFTQNANLWSQHAKLTANDASAGDAFGCAVGIANNTIVVGAQQADIGGDADVGAAYVFTLTSPSGNWTQQQKLVANDGVASDFFGRSVAISGGNRIVIGASRETGVPAVVGSAYLFHRSGSTWNQKSKLTATDGVAGDFFGCSVALSGDTAIVGASLADDGSAADVGAAYIFRITQSGGYSLLVYDHMQQVPSDSNTSVGSAQPFPAQAIGSSASYIFRIVNDGDADLDLTNIYFTGGDSAQFSLTVPDISSSSDLSPGESMEFTVTFNPTGTTNGVRSTDLYIQTSNVAMLRAFSVSGLALSPTADTDGDGLNDWAEYSMRGFGFDWEKKQSNKVNDYFQTANQANLYNPAEMSAVRATMKLINVDKTTNTADLVFELEDSQDLNTYNAVTVDPAKLSVDANGNILYEMNTGNGKKFIHLQIK